MEKDIRYGHMHLHTPASDGLNTPEDIINASLGGSLGFTCITDHDCIDSIKPYSEILGQNGIKTVPGVELTTIYLGKRMHVLVLGLEYEPRFLDALARTKEFRKKRSYGMTKLLRGEGFRIDDRFIDEAKGTLTEGNISEEIFKDEQNRARLGKEGITAILPFMKAYLKRGKPCFFPMERLGLEEYLRYARGGTVLAHPGEDFKMGDDDYIIESLVKDMGLGGIEINTRKHKPEENDYYKSLADRLGIVGVTSNDCHIKKHLYYNLESEETLERLLGREVFA